MTRRLSLAAFASGVLLIAIAYGSAWSSGGTPAWGVWLMIGGSALLMSGMLALGALRSGMRPVRAVLAAILLCIVLLAGFGLPVLLPPENADSTLYFGLPLRAALEVYGVGLLPALFLPLLFALEFREEGLDGASLDQLRAECDQLRHRRDLP